MDTGVVHDLAAARIQLRDSARGAQPPSAVGSETPGRPGLEVRMVDLVANVNTLTLPGESAEWTLPSRRKVAVLCLICTEAALFTIFVVAYIFYIGKSLTGPYPAQELEIPILATICLLSSSVT